MENGDSQEGVDLPGPGDPVTPTSPEAGQGRSDVENRPIGGRLGRSVALHGGRPIEEAPLIIEHREPLIYMLCAAAELEHALMCEYLFAAFTLKLAGVGLPRAVPSRPTPSDFGSTFGLIDC